MRKKLIKYGVIVSGINLLAVLSAVYIALKTGTNPIILFAVGVPVGLTITTLTTRKLRKQIKAEEV